MLGSRSRRRSQRNRAPHVDLTPLIDAVLVLLIIFMVTTPMMQQHMKIDLPQTQSSKKEDSASDNVTAVYIDKNERTYVNDTHVDQNTLREQVAQRIAKSDNKGVSIEADKSLSYGAIIGYVDTVKQIEEVAYVALATEQA
jgi:biopolymer transport protein ExbD